MNWRRLALLLFLLGLLRGTVLVAHQPLLAYANSFDQVRYSGCFDLYPDRPASIPPRENSPWAPQEFYRFLPDEAPICYGSSALLPFAATAALFHLDHAVGGADRHPLRWLAWLQWFGMVATVVAFLVHHARRREEGPLLTHAALFALVLSDPANTLYLASFYAEWTALWGLYVVLGLAACAPSMYLTRWSLAALAFAGVVLGASKQQHLLLPLVLAAVLAGCATRRRALWPRALALGLGGLVAFGFQLAQMARSDAAMRDVREANAVDVVLTGLLASSNQPARTAERLGVAPACLAHVGKHAWEIPGFAYRAACPGIDGFSRGRELAVLLAEPLTAMTLLRRGVERLDGFVAPGLGVVAGGNMDGLPPAQWTLDAPIRAWPAFRFLLWALPLVAGITVLVRRVRVDATELAVLLCAATMVATFGVVLLGDGLADVVKQSHLVLDAALLGGVVLLLRIGAALAARRRATGVPAAATALSPG